MIRAGLALAAGCVALGLIVWQAGAAAILQGVRMAGWAVPAMTCVHVLQLTLSAAAWHIALGRPPIPLGGMLRIRWIREGVNAMLPVAQIGGQVAAIRLLAGRGVAPAAGAAGTVLDVTLEAAAQCLFTVTGLCVLWALRPGRASPGWIGGGLLLTGLGVAAFVVAQRLGLLRLVEAGVARLAARWPALSSWSLAGLHDQLMRLQRDRAGMGRAVGLHTLSWALGSAEVWIALHALGQDVTPPQAFVIESLAMAARSAGFVVPGALGVQEGGFLLAAGLFGVPAPAALSLSILKRLREVVVGVPAVVVLGKGSFLKKRTKKLCL